MSHFLEIFGIKVQGFGFETSVFSPRNLNHLAVEMKAFDRRQVRQNSELGQGKAGGVGWSLGTGNPRSP